MSEITVGLKTGYHRRLEHGDFSLQANTEVTPKPGYFYLLQAGEVLLCSTDFRKAEAAYLELCRTHWESHLVSDNLVRRMASAWGLLGLELTHAAAALVIARDGEHSDQMRLTRMRSRQQAMQARSARTAQRLKS